MGIFSFFFGRTKEKVIVLMPKVDLELFTVDNSILNQPVSSADSFYNYFDNHDVLNSPKYGIEIGAKEGRLDYVFITLTFFKGDILLGGSPLKLTKENSPDDIERVFGEPYWIDTLDDEIIMFYEYRKGSVELQFEFSDSRHLSHITLMMNGILSKEKQREAYKVTKAWPPEV